MFCRNCGNNMSEHATICVSCGVPAGVGETFCSNCGEQTNHGDRVCMKCGTALLSPEDQKSRLVAGLLGLFFGFAGVHRFYLGYTTIGILQILANILCCAGWVWGIVEGILILIGVGIKKDAQGNPLKDI
jgi:TM2 domain-containing membrane protein YozV